MTYSVAVSGASGYAGGEILRILAAHPDVEIRTVTAHSNAGQPLIQHQPHLRSLAHLTLQDTTPEILAGHDIVFLALPHGQSGRYTDALGGTPLVIDAGADHRLESVSDWDAFYGGDFHEPWVYGVPELPVAGAKQRQRLEGATRIAAPGCNASTVSLSLAPGVAAGVIDPSDIVTVLAVGPSGAGKSLKTKLLARVILGTANPYAVGGTHRHIPEIRQALAAARPAAGTGDADRGDTSPDRGIRISFTPVLVPMARGILATSTAPLAATPPMPRSGVRGRPRTATRPSCSCCRRGSSPAPPTWSARTRRSWVWRSIAPRTASSS
jgi:N-acetyl-gamma-glutamyl-phosphate reductase